MTKVIVIIGTWVALSVILTVAFSVLILPVTAAQGEGVVGFFVAGGLLTAVVSYRVENSIANRLRRSSWSVELKAAIEKANGK
jgi:hypothetical protein